MNVTPQGEVGTWYWVTGTLPSTDAYRQTPTGGQTLYTDAEFTAAFVPAERLNALIEAARVLLADVNNYGTGMFGSADALAAALRAYDEGQA